MRRLVIVISVGFIMAIVIAVGAAPTMAQQSPEDKAARKAAKQEQKAVKQQQKAAKRQQQAAKQQPLPPSGGPPVGTVTLYTLTASALVVVGGLFLIGGIVARR